MIAHPVGAAGALPQPAVCIVGASSPEHAVVRVTLVAAMIHGRKRVDGD